MTHEKYIERCLSLAKLGAGFVAPNPMVGAVIVFEGKIIGEGWHQKFGEAHAEVNCLASVKEEDRPKISKSVLYVSLEPCNHYGKTPPCTKLILQHKIPKVVIACTDPYEKVNGSGIMKLKNAGVDVRTGILENEAIKLNKRFFTFQEKKRPYIILKWAQTADGKVAFNANSNKRLLISNAFSNRLVHRWRSEEAAILVGTATALLDNPSLTNRLWTGPSPIRVILDLSLRLPKDLKVFDAAAKTIIINSKKEIQEKNLCYCKIEEKDNVAEGIVKVLYQQQIQSVIVEGGVQLLQTFIDAGLWDEARVVTNQSLTINGGLKAPQIPQAILQNHEKLGSDSIQYFSNK
ncbi:MAG: bifunctional diaminohydroxyphosphoribosylaminopyrimidine deaminase/5-amino-6-(5-phosphoribosylamino)uracil reductase RibD [Chitinophagaceae bacterium]